MNNLELMESRAKGQFPISIATSLALEGLFGIIPEKENPNPPWPAYTDLLINLRTLIRNILGALSKEGQDKVLPTDLLTLVMDEVNLINNIVSQYSGSVIKVSYYVCNYNNVSGLYPFAFFKEVKTDRQKYYAAVENNAIDGIINAFKENQMPLAVSDVSILPKYDKVLLLSHYPLDLLSIRQATDIALLESHTGTVKLKHQWNTKLNDGKNLTNIPFDRMTIQVFGDSGGLFSPYPRDIRRRLLELAETYNWHSKTTRARILQSVQSSKDPNLITTIRRLYV